MSPHDPMLSEPRVPAPLPDAVSVQHGSAYLMHQIDPPPDVTARLEWLDDLMFAAIEGDPVALEAAADAWKNAVGDLGAQAVEESRLQYLRRAQGIWNELRHKPNHPTHKVFAAIEVISLLVCRSH